MISRPNEAIVLAGGFGTRLQSVVTDLPKPMAPVAGKPFLLYILEELSREKIDHVVLAVGYKRESIFDYFGNKFLDIEISYSVEDEPLGTGGAILQATKYIHEDVCFIINGDTFFHVDLTELFTFHQQHNALLSVALKKMHHFDRYGTVKIDENKKVIAFNEKKYVAEGLINGGVYCLDKKIFPPGLPQKFSFETEILEKEYLNEKIFGLAFNNYFIDIGIPEDYQRAQIDFGGNDWLK